VHQLVAKLEALIAADLTHPSIAAPIAAGISGTTAYFAQDFVAADSLDIVVREHGPAPAAEALRVAAQLGGAIDFAATVDVAHGAMHPRDVLISPDDTRVIGHGITRALESIGVSAPIRRPYTAPERAAGAAWDHRADIYTLAVLIFEMLAGKRLAVSGEDAGEALGIAGADVPGLKRLFATALNENPSKRFAAALEFADALKTALANSEPQPSAPSPERQVPGPESRVSSPVPRVSRRQADVALPFEEPQPTDSFDIARVFDAPVAAPIDLDLKVLPEASIREDPEPVIERVSAPEDLPVIQLREEIRDVPAVERRAAKREARKIVPAPVAAAPAADALTSEPGPDAVKSPGDVGRRIAPPTAFIDQSTEEFRDSALEKTRSAIWPLALAIGVGLVVGFAGGYGVAMRDRLMPGSGDAASVAQVVAPPAALAQPAASAPVAPPVVDAPAAVNAKPEVAAPIAPVAPPPKSDDRRRETPAAPAPVALSNGRLVIRSTPAGAHVTVDGKDAGATPATVRELARGPHNVRVTQDGYAADERRIVLTEERMSQAMRFELTKKPVPGAAPAPPAGPGGLMVESRPTGASVFVDGRLIGTTPVAIESVSAGDHSIGLESAGYQRWVGSVRVATGERARITASLER